MNKLQETLNTPDDSDIGYFVEVGLTYPVLMKEKTKIFPFAPENKVIPKENYNDYLNQMKTKNHTKAKKLICDWTDKKTYLVRYRMLNFYVRHGMVVEKIHEIISYKQNKWLEKYINFSTGRRIKSKNQFEKDFYKILKNAFYGKTMASVRNRLKLEFIKKDEYKKNNKTTTKLTFNGIHRSYENCDSYTFKKNEVKIDKPIYLGFAILELSNLHMYEIYYDKLQPYFGKENIQLHYIDTDAFVLSVNTNDINKDLKNLEEIFDFINLDENHELFSNKNEKLIGFSKIETPKNLWIDEFVCLRIKKYALKRGKYSKK